MAGHDQVMTSLDDLKLDALTIGLVGKEALRLIRDQQIDAAYQVFYRAQNGVTGYTIVFRSQEGDLELVSGDRKWSFQERKRKPLQPDGVGPVGPRAGIIQPVVPPGPGIISPPPVVPVPRAAKLPTTYTASVKLSSVTTGPQVGKFLDEVMSHLQALPGVEIEMTLEVQVRAPGGIDEATGRIVLENSAALKVEKPGLY